MTPTPTKENEYECAACHRVFEKGWSEEEQLKEAEEIFGKPVSEWHDEPMVICDDCFQKMNPRNHPEAVAEAKKHL